MPNRLFTLLLSLAVSGTMFAVEKELPYKSDVVIDGVNKEWTPLLPRYDKSTGINYDIANDEKHLFFIIRIADEAAQQRIMQNGLEIWINKQGKKKKVTGITFPLPMTKDSKMGKNRPPEKIKSLSSTERSPEMPLRSSELTLTGFLIDNGKQPAKGCPIQVALSKDPSDCLIYELAVPFNSFYKESLDRDDTNVPFCIGIAVKGTESSAGSNEAGKMGDSGGMGGPGGGMGGPGGGMGGPGGGMGGPGGGMEGMGSSGGMKTSSNSSDKIFWIKTCLAIK